MPTAPITSPAEWAATVPASASAQTLAGALDRALAAALATYNGTPLPSPPTKEVKAYYTARDKAATLAQGFDVFAKRTPGASWKKGDKAYDAALAIGQEVLRAVNAHASLEASRTVLHIPSVTKVAEESAKRALFRLEGLGLVLAVAAVYYLLEGSRHD